MQSVFIRHNFSEQEMVADLWDNGLVAIHYDNIASINPEVYLRPEGRRALQKLLSCCATGAVVGATYRPVHKAKMLVGEITPGSTVEIRDYPGKSGVKLYLKAVSLSNVHEISITDHLLLAAFQPRQRAIAGWESAEKYLISILKNQALEPLDVNALAPAQLEVICYEYLRARGDISALLLPIGRTLPDINIYGMDASDHRVLAQVTHSGNLDWKLERLKGYQTPKVKLILFGPEKGRTNDPEVEFIAIEHVFASTPARLLEAMIPNKR